jgi:hypothetical protein
MSDTIATHERKNFMSNRDKKKLLKSLRDSEKKLNSLSTNEEKAAFFRDEFNNEKLRHSRLLRRTAHAWAVSHDLRDLAIRQEYPLLPQNPIVNVLTLGFNLLVNKQRNKEYDERDRKELAATGKTKAIELSEDKKLLAYNWVAAF